MRNELSAGRSESHGGQLVLAVGFVEAGEGEPAVGGFLAELQESGFVLDGEEGEGVGGRVPLAVQLGEAFDPFPEGVGGLDGLLAGGQVRAGHEVELQRGNRSLSSSQVRRR